MLLDWTRGDRQEVLTDRLGRFAGSMKRRLPASDAKFHTDKPRWTSVTACAPPLRIQHVHARSRGPR